MNTEQLRHLRNAFGTYMTGVTVVTCLDDSEQARGFTANSFTSVSLEPPLVSICIDRSAESFEIFTTAKKFAVNVLSENQAEISNLFAQKRADKFEQINWRRGQYGQPLLGETSAFFECEMFQQVDAGDHVILIGKVLDYDFNDRQGLGYARGGYFRLGLEQSAMQAAQMDAHVEVGAIVEHDGKVLLMQDGDLADKLTLPISGLRGQPGSLNKLLQKLHALGVDINITSLYAVFENKQNEHQIILYRAEAEHVIPEELFYSIDNIPWNALRDEDSKRILARYVEESRRQRFGVYFENTLSGNLGQNE